MALHVPCSSFPASVPYTVDHIWSSSSHSNASLKSNPYPATTPLVPFSAFPSFSCFSSTPSSPFSSPSSSIRVRAALTSSTPPLPASNTPTTPISGTSNSLTISGSNGAREAGVNGSASSRNGGNNGVVTAPNSSSAGSASGVSGRAVPAIDIALERIRESKKKSQGEGSTTNGGVASGNLGSGHSGLYFLPEGNDSRGVAETGGGNGAASAATAPGVGGSRWREGGEAGDVILGRESLQVLPSDESFKWAKDDYNKAQRTVDVWTFVLTLRARLFLIDAKWSYLGGFSSEKQGVRRRRLAAWVRESILQLGPTFIKLGQLSSTRSDLLPSEFVEELAKLQDRVPAFSAEKAVALIERELGQPISVLYKEFEARPIAAASLGQVHRARLHNGEVVVVKVQRPGLKELFDIDLENMKIIAEYFQRSESLGGPTRDWVGIYEECATILYQEIDYLNEGRNADRFRRDFRNYPWVKVPQVYWDYASRKVLTLQYMPGVKISDVGLLEERSLNRSLVARRAIEAYLIQILKTGFFHADPHPGNLAVGEGNALIYYDFGMMGEIPSFTKDRLLQMFYAVYEKNSRKVVDALIDLGALVPTGDMSSVRRSIQFFLENIGGPRLGQDATISAIGEDLFAIAVDQPFRFPATFTFVLRAFSTLEGVGKTLDPDFLFAEIAAPYAQELLDLRDGQKGQGYVVEQLQKQASQVTDATVSMPVRVQRMDDFFQQLENGDVKLRVRVLEAERAARRAGIMQVATMNIVASVGLLNLGVTLSSNGLTDQSTFCFAAACAFGTFVLWEMKRIQRLDKFEKKI